MVLGALRRPKPFTRGRHPTPVQAMSKTTLVALAALAAPAAPATALAQHPLRHPADAVEIQFARSQPVAHYTLRVDTVDLSAFAVELRLRHAPATFRLAMVAHPEYDDRYWRYVEDLRVAAAGGPGAVTRADSALWQVVAPGGEAVVRYRIRLPAAESPRAAWRPFLAATGGLVGGPHSFMYVVGATLAPAHVTLELPATWGAVTGLEPTADRRTFFAPSAARRSWRVRLDPRRAPRRVDGPLLREPGQQSLLSRERERDRLWHGARRAGRLQRQHAPARGAARRHARPDRARRDERRPVDRRRDAGHARALLRGARVRRAGRRTDRGPRVRLHRAAVLRGARAWVTGDRLRPQIGRAHV